MATLLALREPPPVRYTVWQSDRRSLLERYALSRDELLALCDFCHRLFEGRVLQPRRRPGSVEVGTPVRPYGFRRYLGELSGAIDARRANGDYLPPILAERVQLLLQRSGCLLWERAFLAVYLNRYCDVHPAHGHLRQRAVELKVFPLRRTDKRNGRPLPARLQPAI